MEYDENTRHRLRRIEGQVKGILTMMENRKECRDVVTQLSAVRSALDGLMGVIVSLNLEQCIRSEGKASSKASETIIQEALQLFIQTRG